MPSAVEQEIFDATEQLLTETSLDALTVAEILEKADVSRTTFYRYFSSKHQVVSALLASLQLEMVDMMQPWYTRDVQPPLEALNASITAVAAVWERHRPVLRACSENWHSDPEIGERWVQMMDRFVAGVSERIEHERQLGLAPKGASSHRIALALTWGSEQQLYLAGFGMYGPNLERDAVDTLVSIWLGSIYHQ
ncbi:MAG: TetR/AcrR family transcriptional regulator [Solirubrobacterales bacterium]